MQVQKEFMRRRILNAATTEFLKTDYHKASLRKIAEAANITPGNIYRYFKDKAELYEATVEPAWNGIQEVLLAAASVHYSEYSENTIIMITNSLTEIFIAEQDGFMILLKNDPQSPLNDAKKKLILSLQKVIVDNVEKIPPKRNVDRVLIDTLAISIIESMIYIFKNFDGNIQRLKKRTNLTLDLLLNSFHNSLEREIRYAVAH